MTQVEKKNKFFLSSDKEEMGKELNVPASIILTRSTLPPNSRVKFQHESYPNFWLKAVVSVSHCL